MLLLFYTWSVGCAFLVGCQLEGWGKEPDPAKICGEVFATVTWPIAFAIWMIIKAGDGLKAWITS
jgi:hypothetical protein